MPTASIALQIQATHRRRVARDVEGPIHRAILRYLRATLPHAGVIQHTPNKPGSQQQGRREKANGAIAGWPDLAIYGPGENGPCAWFAEIKPPGVKVPDHQREIHDALMECGFSVRVLRSVEDARKAVSDWGLPSNDIQIYGSRKRYV